MMLSGREIGRPLVESPTGQVVCGLYIQDKRLAKLTWWSLCLGLVNAALGVINFVWEVSQSPIPNQTPLGKVISLVGYCALPYCAYLGVKNNDASYTCCFTWLNFCGGFATCCGFILLSMTTQGLQYFLKECDPADPLSSDQCKPGMWTKACPALPTGYTEEECYHYLLNNMGKLHAAVMFACFLGLPGLIIQCVMFRNGRELDGVLRAGNVITFPAPQARTQSNVVQPSPEVRAV